MRRHIHRLSRQDHPLPAGAFAPLPPLPWPFAWLTPLRDCGAYTVKGIQT